jgi:hypothetical protein
VSVGTIVGIIDRREYAPGLDPNRWSELSAGVLVQLANGMILPFGPSMSGENDV